MRLDNLDIRFLSLYRDETQELKCEMGQAASDLKNNAIMQEFYKLEKTN